MQKRLFPITIYCIDTSALINLKRYYPRDIFPAIWEKLENMMNRGKLISHESVFKEIHKRDDELSRWCQENKKMFKDIDDCQINKLSEIKSKIVTDEKMSPNHIPYIANAFQKQCLNLIQFFKAIGIKYEK